MVRGVLASASMIIPKYLNYLHYFSYSPATYTFPLQFTSITSVLLVLITRSFSLQNELNTDTSYCNNVTEGAINTTSSANANINNYRLAIVYARACFLVYISLYMRSSIYL